MTKMLPKWVILSLLIYAIALIGSLYFTYAYYQNEKNIPIQIISGDVEVDMLISFDDVQIDSSSPYYDFVNKTLSINVSDPESMNAITKLKIQLVLRTGYAIRLRVKLLESYIRERYYHQTEDTMKEIIAIKDYREGFHPYSYLMLGSSYSVLLGSDGYEYYPDIIEENKTVTINIIDRGLTMYARDNEQFTESIYLDLSLLVEVVQANRFQELWHLPSDFFE